MTENSDTVQADPKVYESFDEMGLSDVIIRGIYSYGFETPSKIQQVAIVPMSKNNDILAQSQSGTGKTATFTINLNIDHL